MLRLPADAEPAATIGVLADAAVAANPMWAQATEVIPAASDVAEGLADLLDVGLLPDRATPTVTDPHEQPTPPAVLAFLPAAPATWLECDEITVDGADVTWWVGPPRDGAARTPTVYAATTTGLARALAQAVGGWEARSALEILLADPSRGGELMAEREWDAVR